ncbi:MAG: VTT domain-containing protein [Parvularculaceae bacterium]|nr:TVP38/TMEM64 family protein [Parvularculaceae bacterium]
MDTKADDSRRRVRGVNRFAPLIVIAVAAAAVVASGLYKQLSLAALKEHYAGLSLFVEAHYLAALALFALVYIAVTALSVPGATFMSMLGGLFFGIWIGALVVVVAATTGAAIIFSAARTALGDSLRNRAGTAIGKMEAGFRENAFSYLLLLRLIPLFPFFLVNIAPAMFGVSLRTFVAATFIGIIPGAFAIVSVGNGLDTVLATGGDAELSGMLLKPEIVTPIIALSLLALAPIIYKAARKTKGAT